MKSAALGIIVLGFVLLIGSAVWAKLFPATNSWTPDKAARISEIKARLNELGFAIQRPVSRIHGGPDPGALKGEYDTLNAEFDQLKNEFETAAQRPQTASNILKWTGISLAILGVIGWYAAQQTG